MVPPLEGLPDVRFLPVLLHTGEKDDLSHWSLDSEPG